MGIHDRDWNRREPEKEAFWSTWPLWAKILIAVASVIMLVAIVRSAKSPYTVDYNDEFENYNEAMEERMPFLFALQAGDAETIKKMVKANPTLLEDASIGWSDENYPLGNGALSIAIFMGNEKSIIALIESGAQVDQSDDDGRTALHHAASVGHSNLVKLLLDHGAVVDARDAVGFTPLFDAAETGSVGTAKILLEAGADPNTATPDGQTPFTIAEQFHHPRMIALLKQTNSQSTEQ